VTADLPRQRRAQVGRTPFALQWRHEAAEAFLLTKRTAICGRIGGFAAVLSPWGAFSLRGDADSKHHRRKNHGEN